MKRVPYFIFFMGVSSELWRMNFTTLHFLHWFQSHTLEWFKLSPVNNYIYLNTNLDYCFVLRLLILFFHKQTQQRNKGNWKWLWPVSCLQTILMHDKWLFHRPGNQENNLHKTGDYQPVQWCSSLNCKDDLLNIAKQRIKWWWREHFLQTFL